MRGSRRVKQGRVRHVPVHTVRMRPLPTGTFPGVSDADMYAFLDRHAPAASASAHGADPVASAGPA